MSRELSFYRTGKVEGIITTIEIMTEHQLTREELQVKFVEVMSHYATFSKEDIEYYGNQYFGIDED